MAVRIPLLEFGKYQARLDERLAERRDQAGPWSEPLVLSDDIQAFVIVHPPGTPNDTHYHLHDEWWVVMRGEINWYIEDQAEPVRARAGDFVFCPKLHNHHIEPVGSELTVRIGINSRGEFHRYDRSGCRSTPWRTEDEP